MTSLKRKTVSGIKWQVANKVLQKVISVATFAVLARLLEPAAFGLFAMAFVAIDGLGLFKTAGIDSAIIYRSSASDEANDTAFFMILGLGMAVFASCFFMAPLAAHYFKNPAVEDVVKALGVVLLIGSVGRIPSSLLTKAMRFRVIAVIELAGAIANSVCAIAFALIYRNIWSLVGAYILKTILMTALAWYLSGYRLRWHFNLRIANEFIHYGKFALGFNVIDFIRSNLSNVVIGRLLGAVSLGFFVLAANIGNFINTHFTHLIHRVMFPAYSSLQEDREALKRAYLKTVKFVSIISFPFAAALVSLPVELVLTLYGDKWLSVIPLVRLFGAMQFFVPIAACSGAVYMALGRPKYSFHLNWTNLLFTVPLLIGMTKAWGLVGAVGSGVLLSLGYVPLNIYLVQKLVGFTPGEMEKSLRPAVVSSLVMLVFIWGMAKILAGAFPVQILYFDALRLILFGAVGVLAYFLSYSLMDRKAAREVTQMLFAAQEI